MTKDEKIKEAWALIGITKGIEVYCDEFGWTDVNNLHKKDITNNLDFKEYTESEVGYKTMLCRPKSLKDIENNNGWIKIEKDSDLPKENIDCFLCFTDGDMLVDSYSVKYKGFRTFPFGSITHYQPIIKPEPPIY